MCENGTGTEYLIVWSSWTTTLDTFRNESFLRLAAPRAERTPKVFNIRGFFWGFVCDIDMTRRNRQAMKVRVVVLVTGGMTTKTKCEDDRVQEDKNKRMYERITD